MHCGECNAPEGLEDQEHVTGALEMMETRCKITIHVWRVDKPGWKGDLN